jgi:hypothetical protein
MFHRMLGGRVAALALLLVTLALLFVPLALAQDPTPPDLGDPPVELVAEDVPVVSDVVTYGKVITEALLPALLSILTGALLVLGRYAHRWLARKLDIEDMVAEEHRDALVRSIVETGTALAEQRGLKWARERGELPAGAQKLQWALDWIVAELQRRGLPEHARDELIDLIDASLANPAAPGDATRASVVASRLRGSEVDA